MLAKIVLMIILFYTTASTARLTDIPISDDIRCGYQTEIALELTNDLGWIILIPDRAGIRIVFRFSSPWPPQSRDIKLAQFYRGQMLIFDNPWLNSGTVERLIDLARPTITQLEC